MERPLHLVNLRLPTGDGVYCGVTLDPYVLLKRGESSVTADDVPAEGSPEAVNDGQDPYNRPRYILRSRWSRSTACQRGPLLCSIHPDREATTQCIICLRQRVPSHLSYHCTVECMKTHWHLHKGYHATQQSNGGSEANGYMPSDTFKTTSSSLQEWIEVGKTRTYTPTQEDVGYVLKFEISVVDRLHPHTDLGKSQVLYTSRVRPTPAPPARQVVQLLPPLSPAQANTRFTVLTYNLLADLYAKDFSANCPPWSLHWNYRKRNLLRELLAYKADILCLQEVQSDHYVDFWAPELQKAGYTAIYKKKTAELYTENKYAIDGCATFFRRERFSLVKKYEVEFNKAALSLADSFSNQKQRSAALSRLLKDNVALIAVLEAIEPGPPEAGNRRTLICVANTHIHANPELNDVKLWQVHTLLKGLEKIAASADIPMLVAGDFNSMPGSPAHSLLVKGKVDPPAVQSIDPLGFLKEQKLSHQLPLQSAYASMWDAGANLNNDQLHKLQKQRQRVDQRFHEPTFTNISKDFKGTLDYILYTNNSLQPTAVLELPSESEVLSRPDEQLPNAQYSSDHLALLAEFQYVRA